MTRSKVWMAACLITVLAGMSACSGDPGGGNNGQDENNGEADTEVMADADEDASDAGSDAMDTDDETDTDETDSGTDADTETDTTDETAPSSLSLRILDIDGSPIEAASVTVGQSNEQTDADGRITFEDLDVGRTLAAVEADGYAPATEVVELPESTDASRTVHLLATGEPHPFDPTTDSELYEDRVHVTIPANALIDANGDAYTGPAQALITPLNPSTDEISGMPGPLDGILEGDTESTPMESIFMADIQLQTDTGEPLELADGMNATLEFVIPDDLQSDYAVGDEIEAYWYDTSAGVWMQEGMGTVIESTYAAEKLAWTVDVSHFTWWNCDRPWTDKECVRVEVVDASSGDPVSGAEIFVQGESYNGTSYGSSGADGTACLDFKLGSTALVSANSPDGRPQIGNPVQITGNGTAATCAGDGSGTCQDVQLELPPMTCVSGAVNDDNGDPIDGVNVTGYYDGAHGTVSAGATTDASGEYCLPVPSEVDTSIVAGYLDNGTYMSDSTSITA
ncbi:MAG: carboxypeptidase-like regulatory domain-containing protein, partial [Myxococcota bacterium]